MYLILIIFSLFTATTHILPVNNTENAILQQQQQQKPSSSTSQPPQQQQQQMVGSNPSQLNQSTINNPAQQQPAPEQNYFTAPTETQITEAISGVGATTTATNATSPVQMQQNGYPATITNTNVQSNAQSFTQQQQQQQCIGGAQAAAAWTARGSNTLTYTQSMQPPDARAINQPYCEYYIFICDEFMMILKIL